MHLKAQRIAQGSTLESAVCIVGGGPAGLVLAQELGQAGIDVILLEAGGLKGPGPSQTLYRGTTEVPRFHLPPDRDRTRGLGGSSAMWGGRCMPYDPVDFEPRPHVPHSGWPFGRDTLDPFYRRAAAYADCGGWSWDAATAGMEERLVSGFESAALQTETLERWSPPTHFGRSLGPGLLASDNVRVITGAVAVGLERGAEGARVDRVVVKSVRGRRGFSVAARQVVLAGGGMETTRLLLSTGGAGSVALGDHSGWLGRGYMTHVGGVIARLRFAEGQRVIFGYEQDPDGIYVRRRFTFSAEAQHAHRLVNLYALLDRPLLEDADHDSAILSLAWLAKRMLQRQSRDDLPADPGGAGKLALYRRHLRNLVFGAPEVLSVLPRFGRDRFLSGRRVPSLLMASGDNSFYLYFHAEQSPDPDNRLTLDPDDRDALGMPRLRIAARLGEEDAAAILRAHDLIGAELRAAGVGDLEFLEPEDPMASLARCKATLGHHIGTTRMAADPGGGVVDSQARVHGCENLHIASASVLPTSSQAHPTLTILALALRLADHLRGPDLLGGAN